MPDHPPYDSPAYDPLASASGSPLVPAPDTQTYPYAQSQVLGHHLPTPGKPPAWPFHNMGQWRVDVKAEVDAWRRGLTRWRREHLIHMGYDDAEYRRPELAWSQSNFVTTQMMVEDRFFYDPATGCYTVDRYLDDLVDRFGGIDSVLIWFIYPNIGIDSRNQFDMAADLPGGIEGLRGAVSDFHRRGVRVFLTTMPWDNGTRELDVPAWEAITTLAKSVGADGINGDTYYALPRVYREASEAAGHPLVLQAETWPSADDALAWNTQSWGKVSRGPVPAVSKRKWLESRHLENIENRWGRDRTDDFHTMFFNGIGYVAWENVWGIWNQLTARDAETLRRVAAIARQFAEFLVAPDWEPYAPTIQQGVFSTRFSVHAATMWTVVNRNEYDVNGPQLMVANRPNARFFDLWRGIELSPRIGGDTTTLSFDLEPMGFGAVIAVGKDFVDDDLASFLDHARNEWTAPLDSYSSNWSPLGQAVVEVAATTRATEPPPGMVTIPAGEFDFRVNGIEVEGFMWSGVDVQYPWERSPRRYHHYRLVLASFHIDRYPVTNEDFERFLDATAWRPEDNHNFLKHWVDGAPPPGSKRKPVTWVSIEDARAYAAWAGKRLPREWEWQYSAQGTDGRQFPWGNSWEASVVPSPNRGRADLPPDDVDAHPGGASPFGVMDLVGNVWQWTDEFVDDHTRSAVLRGGSRYQPQASHWYFPQAYRLDQHGKYLLMAPGRDRSAMLGFRCVVDASTDDDTRT